MTEKSLSLYLFNVVSTNHINTWNVEMSLKIWSFPQFKKPHVRPSFSSFLLPLLFILHFWDGEDLTQGLIQAEQTLYLQIAATLMNPFLYIKALWFLPL